MVGCFAKGCSSRWRGKETQVSMHMFPRDLQMIRQWLIKMTFDPEKLEEMAQKILSSRKGAYRVCSRHFTLENYELRGSLHFLRQDAIPTLYLEKESPTEEAATEHAYAKRARLEEEESNEMQHSHPTCLLANPSMYDSPSNSQHLNLAVNSLQEQLFHHPAEYSSPEFFEIQAVEEVATTSLTDNFEANSFAEVYVPGGLKKRKPKVVKNTHNISTSTEFFPGRSHKHTQFNKRMGTRDKIIQALRRPPHRSVGIQCKLVEEAPGVPTMLESQTRRQQELPSQYFSEEIDISSSSDSPNYVSEGDEEQIKAERLSDFEDVVSPPCEQHNECRRTTEGEELKFTPPVVENEEIFTDPSDLDISYIALPETSPGTSHINETKFIVFESCLDKLLFFSRCQASESCTGIIVKIKKYKIGSALSVTGFCSENHRFHLWLSQPLIGRMPVGNLLISAGILCSGSTFFQVASFFRLLGILSINKKTYFSNQNKYLFPAVNHHWQKNRMQTIESLRSQPIALTGDGQFDSYKNRAKYCIYNLVENQSKKIIDFQVEQQEPGVSAAILENNSFHIALDHLLADKVNIRVVCTDRHLSIRKLLKDHYRQILHRIDVWHLAKSVGSKIAKVMRKSDCAQLAKWIIPVKNHLLWAAQTCNFNPVLLREKWSSLVYHVTDNHQWDNTTMYKKCNHRQPTEENERAREWIEVGSVAHCQLKSIILNKSLLQDLEHVSNFTDMEDLQILHSISLKYRTIHNHYSIDDMVARSQLAALDHNFNINRMKAAMSDIRSCGASEGATKHRFTFSEADRSLVVEKVCEPTNQEFIKSILLDMLNVAAGNQTFLWKSRRLHVSQQTLPSCRAQT